tara:strand:+ start:313 stop:1104 length:792 start_codon:yes stop_codon:yes gene_type:complete
MKFEVKEMKTNTLYKKTHNITGLMYLGITTRNDPDKYRGSGAIWDDHLKKYGNDVKTEILWQGTDQKQFQKVCQMFSEHYDVANNEEWANVKNEWGSGNWHWGENYEPKPDDTKDIEWLPQDKDGRIVHIKRHRNSEDAIFRKTENIENHENTLVSPDNLEKNVESLNVTRLLLKAVYELGKSQEKTKSRCCGYNVLHRYLKIITMRYGLWPCQTEHTYKEIGIQIGVQAERVRQIESQILRQLRHPYRSKELRKLLETDEVA